MVITRNALAWPLLLVVADLGYVGEEERWLDLLREVAAAGAGCPVAIQVRARTLRDDAWRSAMARARDVVAGDVPLFLNGDAQTALALGYDGVHWPEAATPLNAPPERLRWRSAAVHSPPAARPAERAGADFVVFGSVFTPGSKLGQGVGVEMLSRVVSASKVPVVAIGGVEVDRVRACLAAGARGVAVVSGVLGAASPGAAVAAYVDALAVASGDALPRSGGSQ